MEKKEKDEEKFWDFQDDFEIMLLGSQPPAFTEQDRRDMIEAWEKEKQRRLHETDKALRYSANYKIHFVDCKGSKEAYSKASQWQDFKNIVEIS